MEKICQRIRVESINEPDVRIIWDALAYYIREEMMKKRGVVVPGFGTFTFVERRLDIGNQKELVKLIPWLALRYQSFFIFTQNTGIYTGL